MLRREIRLPFGFSVDTYTATTRRFGAGPVGANWHEAIGVSVVLFGHGFAFYRMTW